MSILSELVASLPKLIAANWYLIPLALLVIVIKTPWFKGWAGEKMVALQLRLLLNKHEYQLINNVTLPTPDGSTQIDHIVVSSYGIFVIETKNMKGWIYGSDRQPEWTQVIYKHKHKFQNPLRQNYKHVMTLADCLNIGVHSINSVVVFVGESTFKTTMPNNVVKGGSLARYIKRHKEILLSHAERDSVATMIQQNRLTPSRQTDKAHVAHVKSSLESKKAIQSEPMAPNQNPLSSTCPKCNREMSLRISKQGNSKGKKFWGCSGFPNCRTILPAK